MSALGKSGHVQCKVKCPLSANSGHRSLDCRVRKSEQFCRNFQPERLGNLEVYDVFSARWAHYRQVGGFNPS